MSHPLAIDYIAAFAATGAAYLLVAGFVLGVVALAGGRRIIGTLDDAVNARLAEHVAAALDSADGGDELTAVADAVQADPPCVGRCICEHVDTHLLNSAGDEYCTGQTPDGLPCIAACFVQPVRPALRLVGQSAPAGRHRAWPGDAS